jgi:hypothetical protein
MVRNAFQSSEHVEMFLRSELVPQDIKLRAHPNMLSNLVDVGDVMIVDDNLRPYHFIRSNYSSQNVNQSSLPCTIMPQNAHELICLYFKGKFL